MAQVGDRVQVPSKKVGQQPREGVVIGVSGTLLRVTWSTGEESTITPSVGSLVVIGRVRAGTKAVAGRAGSQSAGTKKTAKAATSKTKNGSAPKGSKGAKTSGSPAAGGAKRRK
jgi:hypothetical protein